VAGTAAHDPSASAVDAFEPPIVRVEWHIARVQDLGRPLAGSPVAVVRTGFKQKHPSVRILAKTRCQRTSRAAAADDDDVVLVCAHAGLGLVQTDGSSDEGDERLLIDLIVLVEVDRAPRVAFEA